MTAASTSGRTRGCLQKSCDLLITFIAFVVLSTRVMNTQLQEAWVVNICDATVYDNYCLSV